MDNERKVKEILQWTDIWAGHPHNTSGRYPVGSLWASSCGFNKDELPTNTQVVLFPDHLGLYTTHGGTWPGKYQELARCDLTTNRAEFVAWCHAVRAMGLAYE